MKSALAVMLALASVTLTGCVLVPVGPPGSGAYAVAPAVVPPPVVVVRPYYRPWWHY
jgi:hypothetical protein